QRIPPLFASLPGVSSMRAIIPAILFAILFAQSAGRLVAGVPAIPQDPERQQRFYEEKLAWNRRTLGGAYEKVGKKYPRWDEHPRAVVEWAAVYLTDPFLSGGAAHETYMATKRAIEAGCDDPLILYLYARMSYGPDDPGSAEAERRFTAAATAMRKSS